MCPYFSYYLKKPPSILIPLSSFMAPLTGKLTFTSSFFLCVPYIYSPTYKSLKFTQSCFLWGNPGHKMAILVSSPLVFTGPIQPISLCSLVCSPTLSPTAHLPLYHHIMCLHSHSFHSLISSETGIRSIGFATTSQKI